MENKKTKSGTTAALKTNKTHRNFIILQIAIVAFLCVFFYSKNESRRKASRNAFFRPLSCLLGRLAAFFFFAFPTSLTA